MNKKLKDEIIELKKLNMSLEKRTEEAEKENKNLRTNFVRNKYKCFSYIIYIASYFIIWLFFAET